MVNPHLWVPIKFVKAGPHLLVHLVDPATINFNYGFISASLKALPDNANPQKILPLSKWLAETQIRQSELDTIGFIFHISRCGSTLLSQNLKAMGKFIVLGEPSFFTSIYKDGSVISPGLQSDVAQKTLFCWNQWAQYENKQLIVKLTSTTLIHRERVNRDFPDSKTLFLCREPKSVVESLVRKPPGFITEDRCYKDLPGFSSELELQVDKLVLRAGKIYLRSLDEIYVAVSQGVQYCDYADIKRRFGQIIEHFSFGKLKEKFSWCDTWDSKNGEWKERSYKPIAQEVLAQFSQTNEPILKILLKEYDKLNELADSNRACDNL